MHLTKSRLHYKRLLYLHSIILMLTSKIIGQARPQVKLEIEDF